MPPRSPASGPRPASRSPCGPPMPRAIPPRASVTAIGSSAGPAATWCSLGPRWPRRPGAMVPATAWSRSGTACPSCRRSGAEAPVWPGSTTSTAPCGRWSCPRTWPGVGELIESRIAPPLYRRTRVVTLSESSKQEMVDKLRLPGAAGRRGPARHRPPLPARRRARPAAPGRRRGPPRAGEALRPSSSGRCSEVRRHVPDARLTIVGEGFERGDLDALVRGARRRELGRLRRPGRRRRPGRALPTGLGRSQRRPATRAGA